MDISEYRGTLKFNRDDKKNVLWSPPVLIEFRIVLRSVVIIPKSNFRHLFY